MEKYSTGYELVLNACEGALQIVVTNDEKPLCFQEWFQPQKATEILAPALQEIFTRLGIEARVFRRIGCFAGPGSFTGIRLVLATAAAMRRATSAKLARLDYLQALATSAVIRAGALFPERIIVVTHARRDLVHFQKFRSYGPQIPALPLDEARLMPPEEAFSQIKSGKCLVAGSGLIRNAEIFNPGNATATVFLPGLVSPDLAALCLLARHGDYFPEDVAPKYVRGCDAVKNLENSDNPDENKLNAVNKIMAKKPQSDI